MDESKNQAETSSYQKGRKLTGRPASQPPRNYFARKEQYRLLILCSMMMVVLFMMNEARKPATWKWMWSDEPTIAQPAEPIDTRLEVPVRALPSDGFTAAGSVSKDKVNVANYLPGISIELIAPIKDNTVMRVVENDAWLAMLKILKEKPQDEIVTLTTGAVSFAQLFRQTDFYRGQLVTVKGTVHRVEPIQARDNELDIDQLFRWIVDPAGGSNSPIVVYSIEKPDALKLGDDIREEVEFTGFCFKRWAYAAGDGTRIAPLILAKTASWEPPPPITPVALPPTLVVASIVVGIGALAAIIALAVYRTSNPNRPEIIRLRDHAGRRVGELNDDEVMPNVSDALQSLAQSHSHDENQA